MELGKGTTIISSVTSALFSHFAQELQANTASSQKLTQVIQQNFIQREELFNTRRHTCIQYSAMNTQTS